jgi:hypothetical protein
MSLWCAKLEKKYLNNRKLHDTCEDMVLRGTTSLIMQQSQASFGGGVALMGGKAEEKHRKAL